MKVVVVGASSGLGRSIGLGLAERGASVAFLARRLDRLEEAVAEAGDGAVAVQCDVTDEAGCRAAIVEAAEALGGIDGLVYSTGVGPLARLADLDAATWRWAFDANVVGAAIATSAALPYLEASRGAALYLSSVSASLTPPWPGLGAYVVSKTALDKLVEAWRTEYPHVGFTRFTVGDCVGGEGHSTTEFNPGWDLDLAAELAPTWFARNLLSGALIEVAEVVAVTDAVLRVGASASIPSVTLAPRPAPPAAPATA